MGKMEGRDLVACYPHPRFPTLSITGDECAFRCKHCNRRYLRRMLACQTPDVLFRACAELASKGARGVLISGGYNEEGYVPFEPFVDAIERVKRETGLYLNIHPGLMPGWLARELGRAGVDMASVDVIGSDETIELVLGVERTARDYKRTLRALERAIPHVVPHVCIGLHRGEFRGEPEALEMIAGIDFSTLVFLVIVPTPGASFERISPPSPAKVGEFIAGAKLKFPKATFALGCMRPRGSERVGFELAALRAGVERIELPSGQTLKAARELGLRVRRLEACCAVPWGG